MKTTLSFLVFFTSLVLSHSALAETFCGNRSQVTYGGRATFSGDLTADQCLEIGSSGDFNTPEYVGLGTNMNLLDGSLLSVLGYFEDSTVNGGATVYITKVTKIAWDGYSAGFESTGSNIDIKSGGLIRVYDGGTLKNSFLNGGTVYISDSGNTGEAGIGINNTVNSGGKLYVYLGGKSEGTIVNSGGNEYIQQSGTSTNSVINNGGYQRVLSLGEATGTTINSGGYQYVFDTGIARDTVVNDGGVQHLFLSSSTSTAGTAYNTKVYGMGTQNVQQGAQAIGVELNDNAIQRVYVDSSAENVTINDNAISWLSAGAKLLGSTQINDQGQLQLTTIGNGAYAYAESIVLNSLDSSVLVLANSADSDLAQIGDLSGNGKIRFYTATDALTGGVIYSKLSVNNLSGNVHFLFNTSIEDGRGDYLTIQQGSGQHLVSVADSGAEITDPGQKSLDLITDASSGASFSLASLSGTNINAVDGGTYMYSLNSRADSSGEIWYLSAVDTSTQTPEPTPEPTPNPDPDTGTGGTLPPITTLPITTPSTDAVLSMSVAPQLIFNNELQNLRFRLGSLQQNEGKAGAWVRMTDSKSKVGTAHTHFNLDQSGIEIGADKVVNFESGKAFFGAFTSYNNASVKHRRGGTSKIDSYSVGAYGTYFDNSGVYIDGVLKYNHFSNELSAVSTHGEAIRGDYSQNALGASLEVGYNTDIVSGLWAEPYAKLAYVQVEGKDISLNNKMTANIGDQDSLNSELGIHLGTSFVVGGNSTISPYIKAAWVHEYIDNNHTTINKRNKFTTDLSGDMGKYGFGVNLKMANQISMFAEVDYVKGNKIETPIQGNIGVRYNF